MKFFYSFVILVFFSSLANAEITVTAKKTIQEAVKERLKDPGSARYKDIKIGSEGTFCGSVNAKNSYGGYTGFTKFIGMYLNNKGHEPTAIIIGIDSPEENIIKKMCADEGLL